MDTNKPMTLLLIEDDVAECIRYKECAMTRDDIKFIGMTNSGIEGLNYVKTHMPEGVILDLELQRGKGSGLSFLASLNELSLNSRPLIIVTTNSSSTIVYNHAHDNGVDLIFYKRQSGYSPEMVINTFLALRKSLFDNSMSTLPKNLESIESPEEFTIKITDRINAELDMVGISGHLNGRKYLFDAIFLLLQEDTKDDSTTTVFKEIAHKYKRAYSGIGIGMQTSINNAWKKSSIEDLQIHYTAKINYKTGVPTPTEFIYYYVDKIKKIL